MLCDKIMIVDDDTRIVSSIKMILSGYEFVDFQNGKDAMEYLEKPNNVRLVCLDVCMHNESGLDVLKQIKELNRDMTVIIMTAFGSMNIAVQALRYHADDFVEKPFDVEELREKVRQHLKQDSFLDSTARDQDYRIERIRTFVERNYKNVSLETIAHEMCLSEKYVSRMFKKKNKKSFRTYKLNLKIDKAKSLLERTSYNVTQISEQLGYQNPESFMRIFRKRTGVTPSQYRKSTLLNKDKEVANDYNKSSNSSY